MAEDFIEEILTGDSLDKLFVRLSKVFNSVEMQLFKQDLLGLFLYLSMFAALSYVAFRFYKAQKGDESFNLIFISLEVMFVMVLASVYTLFLKGVLLLSSHLSALIFPAQNFEIFVEALFGNYSMENGFDLGSIFQVFNPIYWISWLLGLFAYFSFYILLIYRFLKLTLYYAMGPLFIVFNLLPHRNIKDSIDFVGESIQISLWVVLVSALSRCLNIINIATGYALFSTKSLILKPLFFAVFGGLLLAIPKLASRLFGGTDWSDQTFRAYSTIRDSVQTATLLKMSQVMTKFGLSNLAKMAQSGVGNKSPLPSPGVEGGSTRNLIS